MLRNKECPNKSCSNPFPKMATDGSYYCPECGHQWTDESGANEFLDNQILDHADEIIRLMKLKGFKDSLDEYGCDHIHIWMMDDDIQVQHTSQDIKTIRRKKA